MIIGLTGKAGSGKDTIGAFLVGEYGFRTLSFAAPLKQICAAVFSLSEEQVNDQHLKEVPVDMWVSPEGKARTPREILQIMGTQGFRAVDPDFWVKIAERELCSSLSKMFKGVAITDVRFLNEAAMIQRAGGKIIKVVKTDGPMQTIHTNHQSELEIDRIVPDFIVEAKHGHIEDLVTKVKFYMENVLGLQR